MTRTEKANVDIVKWGLFAIVLLLATDRTSAQTVPIPAVAGDGLPAEVVRQVQSQAQSHAQAMYEHLEINFDEFSRIARLSEPQQLKLRVAAKGAVDRAVVRWIEKAVSENKVIQEAVANEAAMHQQALNQRAAQFAAQRAALNWAGQVNAGEFGGLNFGEVHFVDVAPVQRFQFVEGANVAIVIGGNAPAMIAALDAVPQNAAAATAQLPPLSVTAIEQERLWSTALNHILEPEQKQAVTAEAQARASLPKVTPADRVMIELDRRLKLDNSQREEFAKAVRPLVNARVRTMFTDQAAGAEAVANTVLRTRPYEPLTRILSPTQLSIWKVNKSNIVENRGYESH